MTARVVTGQAQTYGIDEAAAVLGIGRSTLYRQITETGEVAPGVPAIHIRRRVLIPKALLDEYVTKGHVGEQVAS